MTLTLGPMHLAGSAPGEDHRGMHHGGHGFPLVRFDWARRAGDSDALDDVTLEFVITYRVVAVHSNPLGYTLVEGGMAVLAGIFAPDRPADWPLLDRGERIFLADLAGLDRMGWVTHSARAGHRH